MDLAEIIKGAANLGIAGVAVILFYKVLTQHLAHNSAVIEKLCEAINTLNAFIRSKLK